MPGQLIFNFRVLRVTISEMSPICLVFTPLGMKYQWAKIIIIINNNNMCLRSSFEGCLCAVEEVLPEVSTAHRQ